MEIINPIFNKEKKSKSILNFKHLCELMTMKTKCFFLKKGKNPYSRNYIQTKTFSEF